MDSLIDVCSYCGLSLNEAVMAGCGNYLCCFNNNTLRYMYTSPRTVCSKNEIPLLHFEDMMRSFDPGGGIDNKQFDSAATEVTGKFLALAKVEAIPALMDQVMAQLLPWHVKLLRDYRFHTNARSCSFTWDELFSSEDAMGPVDKDINGVQTPCSSDDREERELSSPENVNKKPLSQRLVSMMIRSFQSQHDALKPEEVNELHAAISCLMSFSSSGSAENKNALEDSAVFNDGIAIEGKDAAAGTSCVSEIGGTARSSSIETSNQSLGSRLANIENKVARHESLFTENNRLRQTIINEINDQRSFLHALKNDIVQHQCTSEKAFRELKSNYEIFQGQLTEISNSLNMQTSLRVREELARLIRNSGFHHARIQQLSQIVNSLTVMVDSLTEKITKVCRLTLACEAPGDVQGVP